MEKQTTNMSVKADKMPTKWASIEAALLAADALSNLFGLERALRVGKLLLTARLQFGTPAFDAATKDRKADGGALSGRSIRKYIRVASSWAPAFRADPTLRAKVTNDLENLERLAPHVAKVSGWVKSGKLTPTSTRAEVTALTDTTGTKKDSGKAKRKARPEGNKAKASKATPTAAPTLPELPKTAAAAVAIVTRNPDPVKAVAGVAKLYFALSGDQRTMLHGIIGVAKVTAAKATKATKSKARKAS